MHAHADLNALAESLISLKNRPDELERLARLSRTRYIEFHESAMLAMRRMFVHPKLNVRMAPSTFVNPDGVTELAIAKEDPTLRRAIYNILYRYYKQGERSNKVAIAGDARVRMDGDGAPSYLAEVLSRTQLHDDDYMIFRAFSDPEEVILDIGANWGYSVASIWSAGARTKIISFEPITAYQEGLQTIKGLYPGRYDFRMVGLANKNTEVNFVVPVVNGIAISALASASPPVVDEHLEILAKNIHEHVVRWMSDVTTITFRLFEFRAPVKKLDDVLAHDEVLRDSMVAAMKIDVEGYECEVLKGAESTLRRHKPLVMLEGGNRHEGLPSFMTSLGYLYAERSGKSLRLIDGIGTAINGFFVHRENISIYQAAGICHVHHGQLEHET